MSMRSLCILALIVVCIACSEKKEKKNRFDEPVHVKIADLQDRRSTDSLISYLYSDNMEYRKAAALAMASVQDTLALDTLGKLAVPDLQVRLNAAFALGQMYNASAMKWLKYGEPGDEPEVQREILEAMGKVTGKNDLGVFFSEENDPMFHEGAAWGIYRAGLRGLSDTTTANLALSLLAAVQPGKEALGAAHFFSRTAFTASPEITKGLVASSSNPDAEVRMAVVSGLAKLKAEETLTAITKATTDTDYRVRVNAARALRTQPWDASKPLYEKLLADSNAHVTIAAAEVISGIAKDTAALLTWARKASNWRTQATLYECLLKTQKSENINKEIQDLYKNSDNPYQQAALLTALSNGSNADFAFEQFKASTIKVIKSTAASAIARINRHDPKTSPKFADIYKQIISDGDQGAIIYACGALSDSTLGFKKVITDFAFLEEAKSKLSLPKDYETYVPLEQTLNYFKDLPPPPPLKNEYNHPIDWKLAATIDKDQKVVIETTKGKIVMQLFIEEAPGSVVNFVKLVNDKYFDGKFVHRVVPNFVMQTGCDRGDGFGSLDYSIRSEFSRRKYKTGSVGMASAGKDTEGTQWFITHSPTPHLDGKYTIFAEVIDGMVVVHRIEVGDQIISCRLLE